MRHVWFPTLGLLVALSGGLGVGSAELPETPDQVVVLVMSGTEFNLGAGAQAPLIEAKAGDIVQFIVHVPAYAEPHTFHIHGHPWIDLLSGTFVDAKFLKAGETHQFTIIAGLNEGHTGDWLYHCHMEDHFEGGMWGILRVHPADA